MNSSLRSPSPYPSPYPTPLSLSPNETSSSPKAGKSSGPAAVEESPAELLEKSERSSIREGMEKWKMRRLDTTLDLTGRAFLEEELAVIGMTLKYGSNAAAPAAAAEGGVVPSSGASATSATAASLPSSQWYQFSRIYLSRCFISSADVTKLLLAAPLYNNKLLTHLDLSSTKLGDDGCRSLVSSLHGNVTLSHLDLRNCSEVSLKGALLLLALVLPPPSTEEDLAIESTLTPEELLLNGPGSSGRIKDIDLYKNYVASCGIKFVAAAQASDPRTRESTNNNLSSSTGPDAAAAANAADSSSSSKSVTLPAIDAPKQQQSEEGAEKKSARPGFRKSVGKALAGMSVFSSKSKASLDGDGVDTAKRNATDKDQKSAAGLPAMTLLNPTDVEDHVNKLMENFDVKMIDVVQQSDEQWSSAAADQRTSALSSGRDSSKTGGDKSPMGNTPRKPKTGVVGAATGHSPGKDPNTTTAKNKARGLFQSTAILGRMQKSATSEAEKTSTSGRDSSALSNDFSSPSANPNEGPSSPKTPTAPTTVDAAAAAAAAAKEAAADDYDEGAGDIAMDFLGNMGITDETATRRIGVRPTMKTQQLRSSLKTPTKMTAAESVLDRASSAGSAAAFSPSAPPGSVLENDTADEKGESSEPFQRLEQSKSEKKSSLKDILKGKSLLNVTGQKSLSQASFKQLVDDTKGFDPILDSKVAICPSIKVLNGIKVQEILTSETLKELNLSGLGLGDVEAYLLRHILLRCLAVEKLDLSSNKFKTSSMQLMKGAIAKLPLLSSLNVSSNMLFSSSGDSLAGIIAACKLLVSVNLANTELTNGGSEPLAVRELKEGKEKLKPDMSAAQKLCDALQTHKNLVNFDLSGNCVNRYIEGLISDRLKVNKAMLHDKSSFLGFVDVKYDLQPRKGKKSADPNNLKAHASSLGVDYDFFDRERQPLTAFLVRDDLPAPPAEPEKNVLESIAHSAVDAVSNIASNFTSNFTLASIPSMSSMPSLTNMLGGGGDSSSNLAESPTASPTNPGTKRMRKTVKPQTRGRTAQISDVWDNNPVSFTRMSIPHEEIVRPKTPLYIHEVRKKTSAALQKHRCGSCIGCMALTRCENQGAYSLTDETVQLIRTGFFDREGDGSLQDAMKLLRARKEPVKALAVHGGAGEKKHGNRRRTSVIGFRKAH